MKGKSLLPMGAATLRWSTRWVRPGRGRLRPLALISVAWLAMCAACGGNVEPTADVSTCAGYVDLWASPNHNTISISKDGKNYLVEVSGPDGSAAGTYVASCSNGKLGDLPSALGDVALIRGGAAIAWAGEELTRA